MGYRPDSDIVEQYTKSIGRVSRRVAVYEADGVTPWSPFDTNQKYLIDGSVSVDYDRAERRALSLTLDNTSGVFDSEPGGFWYDKIIKVYRGLEINQTSKDPTIIVVVDTENEFLDIKTALAASGFYNVRYYGSATKDIDIILEYDIAVFNDGALVPSQPTLVQDVFNAGVNVLTIGTQASSATYPQIFGATMETTSATGTVRRYNNELPDVVGWGSFTYTPSGTVNTPGGTLPPNAKRFATRNTLAPFYSHGVALKDPVGKRWIHLAFSGQIGNTGFNRLLGGSLKWLNPRQAIKSYEIQIGEFMIDSISEEHFPHHTVIEGRDYTKKLMLSQFPAATQFGSSAKAELTIRTIAINAGINSNKIILPSTTNTLGTVALFDRGTSRWDAIKQIADAFNLEVYFDNQGWLVVRPFQDPTTGSAQMTFKTGADGNLVSYTRSANDTSIFNHIVVAGESSDSTAVPVWAEAKNVSTKSPTSIAKLGDRVFLYTSPLMRTKAQCTALAKQYLAIYSLEEFQMNWDAICIDWLEVGDVIRVIPEKNDSNMPMQFLLTQFNLPLTLAPMSGSGKRMLVVN